MLVADIITEFKRSGIIGPDIYYVLQNISKTMAPLLMRPSAYAKEITLSPKERLARPVILPLEKKAPTLSFIPPVLIFQSWKINEEVKAIVVIRNISQLLVNLGIAEEASSNFKIKPSGVITSRLAPGMSLSLQVTFIAEFSKDYVHHITLVSDTENYTIPFLAIGPRPLFDIPDHIEIPPTPIKMEKSKSVYIRNIGSGPANCIFRTDLPFYVSPDAVYIKPQGVQEVVIGFKSVNIGEFSGSLIAAFESGKVSLSLDVHNVSSCGGCYEYLENTRRLTMTPRYGPYLENLTKPSRKESNLHEIKVGTIRLNSGE